MGKRPKNSGDKGLLKNRSLSKRSRAFWSISEKRILNEEYKKFGKKIFRTSRKTKMEQLLPRHSQEASRLHYRRISMGGDGLCGGTTSSQGEEADSSQGEEAEGRNPQKCRNPATAPDGFDIVPDSECPLPGGATKEEMKQALDSLSGKPILYAFEDHSDTEDGWFIGHVVGTKLTKTDLKKAPGANCVVEFKKRFTKSLVGNVACELSKNRYGVKNEWVLLKTKGEEGGGRGSEDMREFKGRCWECNATHNSRKECRSVRWILFSFCDAVLCVVIICFVICHNTL